MNTDILYALGGVVALVLADWLLGVLAAVRAGSFSFDALPRQLETTVLPVVGSLTVLAVLQALAQPTSISGPLAGAFTAAAATFVPKAVLDIVEKVGILVSGPPSATAVAVPAVAVAPAPAAPSVVTGVPPVPPSGTVNG